MSHGFVILELPHQIHWLGFCWELSLSLFLFINCKYKIQVRKSMCRIKQVLTERAIEDPDPRRSADMKRMINALWWLPACVFLKHRIGYVGELKSSLTFLGVGLQLQVMHPVSLFCSRWTNCNLLMKFYVTCFLSQRLVLFVVLDICRMINTTCISWLYGNGYVLFGPLMFECPFPLFSFWTSFFPGANFSGRYLCVDRWIVHTVTYMLWWSFCVLVRILKLRKK